MKSKKVSRNTLKRIITSPDFVDTVEKCVNITEETGYESRFDIGKKIFGNSIIYSPTIEIGKNDCVGGNAGLERAARNYEEITGKRVNIRNIKEAPHFLDYLVNQDPTELKLNITNYSKLFKNLEKAEEYYGLITLHTHPGGNCSPSKGDLKNLNHARLNNLNGGIVTSPISIVCGVKNGQRKVPLYLLQERDFFEYENFDEPDSKRQSPSEDNYKYALIETEYYWNSRSNTKFAISSRVSERIFGMLRPNNLYNKEVITFDRKKRTVELSSNFNVYPSRTNLSKFEFNEVRR